MNKRWSNLISLKWEAPVIKLKVYLSIPDCSEEGQRNGLESEVDLQDFYIYITEIRFILIEEIEFHWFGC